MVAAPLLSRTRLFALRIINLYTSLPKSLEAQVIGKQLLRSGTSVGAHYREAKRARSKAEFVSKLDVGMQELEESLYWFELLVGANITTAEKLSGLIQEANEIMAMLAASSKKAKENNEVPKKLRV